MCDDSFSDLLCKTEVEDTEKKAAFWYSIRQCQHKYNSMTGNWVSQYCVNFILSSMSFTGAKKYS